ncbi:O-antigen translocase [Flavobacterium subsaxonicum]|uniref:O-antigen translocase n=1 Tax=Flavobacterium subsaxonicum TaxID=426226 RepID=UPI000409EF40|nr:O-antigen translocase [Flavobacterium subsaxonicum]
MGFIKNILKSPLFRLSSLNSLSLLVRVAGGLLGSKMIALFIGPSGMAVTGNLRNLLTSVDAFSTFGMQNGIIKYTAENSTAKEQLNRILATTFLSIFIAIAVLMLIFILPATYWSAYILGSTQYAWVFRVLGITLPMYTGNLIFLAVLNGLGNYKQVIYLNIYGNIVGVLSTALLIWQMGLSGALLGLTVYPSILFFFSAYHMQRLFPGFTFLRKKYFDKTIFNGLLSYSFMSLVTAVLGPVIYIAIRNMITGGYSANEAGYWDAVGRIANFYLMFATTMLTVYFLPKLSKAHTNAETKAVFKSYYKLILPVFGAGLLLVYVLREFIIRVLFAKNFLPMENLFVWQLCGDFFKVCSLILGYEFFAKKMTKAFIFTEVFSFALLYISSYFLVDYFGAEGAVMAHAITYFFYFLVLAFYFRKKLI